MGSYLFPDSETYQNKNTHCHLIELAFKWNSAFLTFSFVIVGTSKKVLQFLMPLEPIYNKNFCFNEQNVYYEHCYNFAKSFQNVNTNQRQ